MLILRAVTRRPGGFAATAATGDDLGLDIADQYKVVSAHEWSNVGLTEFIHTGATCG